MHPGPDITPRRVVIAGGGISALEALLVLGDRGEQQLHLTLVSDRQQFVLRPQMIGEPWGGRAVRADLHVMARSAAAVVARERLVGVLTDSGTAMLASGNTLPFDDLVVAVGAQPSLPFTGAQTIGFGSLPAALAAGAKGSVTIVIPSGTTWTLPAYQLALHIATSSPDRVRVVTPERAPLAVFGTEAATAAAELIAAHGVEVDTGAAVRVGSDVSSLGDTVLALPLLRGPGIAGIPTDVHGFHPVDEHQRVSGAPGVYVVGDATGGQVKQGGLAALQADAAAAHIAHRAGAAAQPEPYAPILRGKLVASDGTTLYLRRTLDGTDPGRCSSRPLWQPAGVLCAWRLVSWLEHHRDELDGDPLEPLAHTTPTFRS